MSDPGPAQLELIRRYARTLRALQADAMTARGTSHVAPAGRSTRTRLSGEPIRRAARAMAPRTHPVP